MKSTLSKIVIFAAGALVGSAVTYKVLERKYENIIEEEIESVKDMFLERIAKDAIDEFEEECSDDEECDEDEEYEEVEEESKLNRTALVNDYKSTLRKMNYSKGVPMNDEDDEDRPYVIKPEEFDELDGYDAVSLTYYADGVLTDEWDEVIDDVDEVVGKDSLTHFGEYEDDSVFVRNDSLRCDYEILLDQRRFADIEKRVPHRAEGSWDETE